MSDFHNTEQSTEHNTVHNTHRTALPTVLSTLLRRGGSKFCKELLNLCLSTKQSSGSGIARIPNRKFQVLHENSFADKKNRFLSTTLLQKRELLQNV
jgi:hypothetical protein